MGQKGNRLVDKVEQIKLISCLARLYIVKTFPQNTRDPYVFFFYVVLFY